jgi:glycosyltransferase involved in cell wall biosynthesis
MPLVDHPWERGKCGYKLVQYMASGLPVVASPVGVNTELVAHGINGFLASSAAEWVDGISRLVGDERLRSRMAQAGRERVIKTYSLQAQVPRVASMFHSLLR